MAQNKVYNLLFVILLYIFIAFSSGCLGNEKAVVIDIEEIDTTVEIQPKIQPIRIAVSAMVSPIETLIYYEEILDYISEKTGHPVELVQRETYAEINELVESQYLDVAFVCTGAYVDGHDKFDMELLAAPVVNDETLYYSYIIVPIDSDATCLEDLRGKKFAFTDPMSNTGKLSPTYMLALINKTPNSFFSGYIFTHSHDESIKAVAKGLVDGASVDSLVWDYADNKNPIYTDNTKVIAKSQPFGIPPIVVHPNTDPEMKNEIRDILITMHDDPKGADILMNIGIDKFIIINDSLYDPVREMRKFTEVQDAAEK